MRVIGGCRGGEGGAVADMLQCPDARRGVQAGTASSTAVVDQQVLGLVGAVVVVRMAFWVTIDANGTSSRAAVLSRSERRFVPRQLRSPRRSSSLDSTRSSVPQS